MLFYILSRLGSICRGLASTEAWHAILFPVTPWQHLPRLGMLLQLFYLLSRLGSICRGLACYANILSRLGSICRGLAFYSISYHGFCSLAGLQKPRLQKPELQKLKLNKQRDAGVLE